MFPPKAGQNLPDHAILPISGPSSQPLLKATDRADTASPLARRGFLRGFLAMAPAVAIAAAAAQPATAALPKRENWKLLRLGEQLAAIDASFMAELARKAEARAAADRLWPEPPAEITFPSGTREPAWCGVHLERDIDNKTFYYYGNKRSARKVADAWQLETYVGLLGKLATKSMRADAIEARNMLAIARAYEDAREAVIESTGYGKAKDDLYVMMRRLDRIVELVAKCESKTLRGLAIKARTLTVAMKTHEIDDHLAFRARALYAESLARSILDLEAAI